MALKLPDFKKISKRERIAVAVGVCILFAVLSDRLVVAPWMNHRNKMIKEIKMLEQTAAGRKLLLSRMASITVDEERYKKYIHMGQSSEVELAAFLKEIENLAAQSQLSLQEVRPISTEGGEWYQEYGLEVHCLASLAEWTKFVYLIESSTSMLTIERANVGLEKEGSRTLKGSMRIKRLVLLDQPAKPAVEE
jgi:Tfp pilus assembly protein PilO